MNHKINVVLFKDKPEVFTIQVNESNVELVKKKLKSEKTKMINYLINLHELGKISSIRRPKNKQKQDKLNEIIEAKKIIKKSLNTLNTLYR
jgi:hypothetical protein